MSLEVDKMWTELRSAETIRVEKAISCIFNYMDDWMIDDRFDLCDEALVFNPENEQIETSLAFLSITFCAKEKLSNRLALYEACKKHYEKVKPNEAAALLRGLE
jgi:hypothetical protein